MAVITAFTPIIVSSVSFSTYIGLGNTITLANAFAVLVFFNMLREPIWAVPDFLTLIADMLVSMNRIQEYLESDEVEVKMIVQNTTDHPNYQQLQKDNYAVKIENHSFSWGVKIEEKKEEA